jgi:ribosome-associated protein
MWIDGMGASKSAKKREFLALQDLGEQLVGLSEEQLRSMGLEENLLDAVTAAAGMKSRGALRRQCQLIGKLMRHVDPGPIRQALETLQRQETADKEIFRQAEHWRDRIVHDAHDGLNEFFELTGVANEALSSTLDAYVASYSDSARKALRRKIFRQVHEDLRVQNSAR